MGREAPKVYTPLGLLTGRNHLEQPDAVKGMREGLELDNQTDMEQLASPYLRRAQQEFEAKKGFSETLGYLARNPAYAGQVLAEQVPQVAMAVVPGSKWGTLAAQGLTAAGQAEGEVAESLRRKGASSQEIAEAGSNAGLVSGLVNTALGPMMGRYGGMAFESAVGRELAEGATRSATAGFARGIAGETATNMAEEAADQANQNFWARDPLLDGVGKAAALGGLMGAGMGTAAGAANVAAARADARERKESDAYRDALKGLGDELMAQDAANAATRNANLAQHGRGQVPLADSLPGTMPAIGADGTDAIAREDTGDIDALLAQHLPLGLGEQLADELAAGGVFAGLPPTLDASRLGQMLAGDLMPGGEVRVHEADPISRPNTSQAVPDGGNLGVSLGADTATAEGQPLTMQNRDRSRMASVAQMQDIRRNPDPERLGFSRDPNTGAPMVGEGVAVPDADKGIADTVVMANGRRVPVRYAVVEAGSVAASHDADGHVNPAYDAAPLKALNNGRTAGLQAAWAGGYANAYREGIMADARLHGVSPEAIASKQRPMLVRLYDPASNTGDMGAESNALSQLGLSPVEQAQTDARTLPDMSGIQWAEDGSISPASNAAFFRAWFHNIGKTQAATLQDAQGRPNAMALQRLKAALVYQAYGDERLLTALAEDVNPDRRNVLNALAQAAPEFAAIERDDVLGNEAKEALTAGLELLRQAAERGLSVQDMVNQGDMLGRNPVAETVALFMADNARSAKRMAEAFRAVAEHVGNARMARATLDIFGNAPEPTLRDSLEYANERLAQSQEERTRQARFDVSRIEWPDAGRNAAFGHRAGEPSGGGRAAAGDAGNAGAPEGLSGGQGQVSQGAGLFGAPTTRDFVDAARRAKDAERDGRTGTGRTDMLAGDGELFAGPRPAQVDIEDAPRFSRGKADGQSDTEREFDQTERAYGGRDTYERAKDAGRTKLTFQQWVQVRTPAFKRWFGDWEAVRAQQRLDAMEPVKVRVPDEWRGLDKQALRAKMVEVLNGLVERQQTIHHPEIGDIRIGRQGIGKTKNTSADPAKILISADIKQLLPASIYARSEPSRGGDGADIEGYSTLLAKVDVAGVPLVAAFTVRRQHDGKWYYNSVALHDGQEKARESNERTDRKAGSLHAPFAGLSDFIRRPLQRVNPAEVSKVVNPETGEPLVVYHGTARNFDAFDNRKTGANDRGLWGRGHYFASSANTASSYAMRQGDGAQVIPAFVALKHPLMLKTGGDLVTRLPDGRDYRELLGLGLDGSKIKDIALEGGHDGVVQTLPSGMIGDVLAYNPNQIKSATGNTGAFDGENPDIRYSKATDAAQGGHSQARKAEVQGHVDAIRAKWKNAPEVVVAADMQDAVVPQAVRDADAAQKSQGAQGSPEGFFYQGKVYLIASELPTAEDAARVLLHEALGHYGLRGVFGQKLVTMLDELARHRQKDVVAKAREYGLHGLGDAKALTASDAEVLAAMSQRQKLEAAEEVLAEMAQTQPELGWVRRALAAIRAWLREHLPGLAKLAMTDAEIINSYLLPARRFVERGRGADAGSDMPFSRSAMKDMDANMRRGREALARAVSEKTSVHRAMYRNGLGWVDFVWGDEGRVKPSGKTVGAMGLTHIIEARQRKDGMSEPQVMRLLDRIVGAIAKGQNIAEPVRFGQVMRVGIRHNGTIVWLTKRDGTNAWLVTGYEENPDGANAGRATYAPTHTAASLTRDSVGAGNATLPDSVDEGKPRFSRTPAQARSAANIAKARARNEARREEVRQTLDAAPQVLGWNYDHGAWEGHRGQANRLRAEVQDKMLAWRDAQAQLEEQLGQAVDDAANVYRLENLMHGRTHEGIERLERNAFQPLIEAMHKAKVKAAELEEYIYALHAKERNASIAERNPKMPDGGSGMTNAEADAILAKADKARLHPLAEQVRRITRQTRNRLLAHGLITQETYDAMNAQYQWYVPLKGQKSDEKGGIDGKGRGNGGGRGIDGRMKPVKEALARGAGAKNGAAHRLALLSAQNHL